MSNMFGERIDVNSYDENEKKQEIVKRVRRALQNKEDIKYTITVTNDSPLKTVQYDIEENDNMHASGFYAGEESAVEFFNSIMDEL